MKSLFFTPFKVLALYVTAIMLFAFTAQSQNTLVHFWYFDGNIPNNTPLEELEATYSLTDQEGLLQYQSCLSGYPFDSTHPNWRKASMERRNNPTPINYRPEANNGQEYDADDMRGIQVKQPFSGDAGENTMIFHLPTTGFDQIIFSFAAVDEGAADALVIDYSHVAGDPQWIETDQTAYPLDDSYQLYSIDFSPNGLNIAEANDNANFKIRIRFQGEDMDVDDGDRVTFNNVSLDGNPLNGINYPPVIANPLTLKKLIENNSSYTIDLLDVFEDPDGDPLTFTATSNRPDFVEVQVENHMLTLTPLQRADAVIELTANDGNHPDVEHSFRVLVYPKAYSLQQDDFVFNQWNNNEPDYAYPDHMLFLQTDFEDPGVDAELLFPYFIPHDDYNDDDEATIGFPYNNTRRTRINGLGVGGISFINTGRERDLGGALLALNTTGQTNVKVSFLAGTMLQNERVYALRLQYRIGVEGPFQDLMYNDQVVEYTATLDGDMVSFENIGLPSHLLNHEYVQLLWRYYHQSGDSGPRAMLRLDDVMVTRTLNVDMPENLNYHIFSAFDRVHIESSSNEAARIFVYNTAGQKLHSETLSGQGLHKLSRTFESGIYIVTIYTHNKPISKKVVVQAR